MRGIPGALACVVGLLAPSMVLMVAAGTLCGRFGALPELHDVLSGLAAAGGRGHYCDRRQAGGAACSLSDRPTARRGVATFVAIGVLRLSLPLVLLAMVPVSIGFAWRRADQK
jgi:chromate transporter